jgi:8-oxo-dGTP pyrophosphatase MutT (NUDIX family)
VFTHPESPEAGIQVPAGTVERGEDPAAAAMREAQEETGLSGLRLVTFLGRDTRDMSDCGTEELQHRWFYHIACDATPPERWTHGEFDAFGNLLIPFDFFWAQLPDGVPDLVADYDDMLPALMKSLETGVHQRLEDNAGLPPPSSVRSTAFARRLPGVSQP